MPNAGPNRPDLTVDNEVMLGKLLLEQGFLSQPQLEQAISAQVESDPPRSLPDILLDLGLLSPEALREIVTEVQRQIIRSPQEQLSREQDRRLADFAVEMGFVTAENITSAFKLLDNLEIHGLSKRLGDILIEKGFLNNDQLKSLYAELKLRVEQMQICPGCGNKYDVSGLEEGRLFRCRKCLTVINIGEEKAGMALELSLIHI